MHVISQKKLREFWLKHADAQIPLRGWYKKASCGQFANLIELQSTFSDAEQIQGTYHIFNVGGNNYRILANVEYNLGRIYILAVMTHAEYSKQQWKGKYNVKAK